MNDESNALRGWMAIAISLLAIAVSSYGVFQTNNIAQKNNALQKEIQQQSQAVRDRTAAEAVAITTVPDDLPAGQPVQGILINNGAKETITGVEVVFTSSPQGSISAVSYIPRIISCQTIELDFTDLYSPPEKFDAWLYFKDADGNLWLINLFGSFSKVNQEPTGTNVSSEINFIPGTMPAGTCI